MSDKLDLPSLYSIPNYLVSTSPAIF